MSSTVITSPGATGAFVVSQPVAPPPMLVCVPHHVPGFAKPVPASSDSPAGHPVADPGVLPLHAVVAPGVHRSRNAKSTLGGIPCESTVTFSAAPPLNAL